MGEAAASYDVGTFERERPRLCALAYRMLSSMAEAEDVAQDAFLRWQGEDHAAIASPPAFLTTVVTRLCLDQLKSARAQREAYVGPWLSEPLAGAADDLGAGDPKAISLAFLVVLESLSPLERAAFLLSEVFDYSHAEVAAILGRDEAACRKLSSRARTHVAGRRPLRFNARGGGFSVTSGRHEERDDTTLWSRMSGSFGWGNCAGRDFPLPAAGS
jgi:RNA polymerase sigma-70 factor, ECF subfamily